MEMILPSPCNSHPSKPQGPRWIPTPAGYVKINVDAATSENSSMVAVAAVARDAGGLFLGASALVLKGITEAEIAESLACREGLALARDLLIRRFRLASNCANMVKNLTGDGMGSDGQIIKEVKAG